MPPKFPPAAPAVEAKTATWPDLRAALESNDQVEAERIAYSLGIPSPAIEGFRIAVSEATRLQAILDQTEHADQRLDDTRRRLNAVRQFVPQDLKAAEERATREAELSVQECRLTNEAGSRPEVDRELAALWCVCPELFGVAPGTYRAWPRGRFGEWLQSRDISPKAGWWKDLSGTPTGRTVRIVPAHSK